MAGPLHPPLASPGGLDSGADCAPGIGDWPTNKRKRQRRREPSIPQELRNDVMQHARLLTRKYRKLFAADPELKERLSRLLGVMLPPKLRGRGRPGRPDVTLAIDLLRRRQYPQENRKQIWARIYPLVIPGYDGMAEIEQQSARDQLRQRVTDRLRKRARWKRLRKIQG